MFGYLLIKNYSSPMESNPEEKAPAEEPTIITESMLTESMPRDFVDRPGRSVQTCILYKDPDRVRWEKRKRAVIVFFSGVGLVLFLLLK